MIPQTSNRSELNLQEQAGDYFQNLLDFLRIY